MASEKKLIISIDPKDPGHPNIEADGFSDSACLKETEGIIKALGSVVKQTKKPEVLRTAKETVSVGKK
jgi:hypothetical protein